MQGKPLVGIPACRKFLDPHQFHGVGEKYIAAVSVAAHATPIVIPALGRALDVGELLQRLDGLLLTGSPSNVEPHHYGGPASRPGTLHDPQRDATTLPLIHQALDAQLPVLAICRGFQEMNVAFGGTLHQHVQEGEGLMDHREDSEKLLEERYASAHDVALTAGGVLAGIADTLTLRVNSLHSQGVDRLGADLTVEAVAADGLVEAFRVTKARGFAIGVQWHPEWQVLNNAFSSALFAAFGNACRQHLRSRNSRELHTEVV